jgi:hypothetical protein
MFTTDNSKSDFDLMSEKIEILEISFMNAEKWHYEFNLATTEHREPGYLSGIGLGYGLDDRGFESR